MEEKKRYTLDEAGKKYPGCKVLMINVDISDMNNITGEIAYISENKDTLGDLIEVKKKYESENCITLITGMYRDSFSFGVIYDVTQNNK